jgi:uncharacterized membrane protein
VGHRFAHVIEGIEFMATLTAWKFSTVEGADRALAVLKSLQAQQIVSIQDGAIVRWDVGKKKPKTEQLVHLKSTGALSGAFWGMLFGLLFFIPFLGLAIGAAAGALTASFEDYGIDDNFIKSVQSQVTPGTSALFLLGDVTARDRVIQSLRDADLSPELIASNLSAEQEAALRDAFGEDA